MRKKRIIIFCALLMSIVLNVLPFSFIGKSIQTKGAEETVSTMESDVSAVGNTAVSGESATENATETENKSFAEKVADKLSALPDELVCFVISMVPVIELRGGLIVAAIKDIPLFEAIGICMAGNLVPIPFILLLITPIFAWLKKTKLFRPLVEKLEKKSMGKSEKIKKYEFLGLVLFVGIPLPGTGAWTGSLIAALLDIKFKKAFPAICVGLVVATVIMCLFTYLIPWLITSVF